MGFGSFYKRRSLTIGTGVVFCGDFIKIAVAKDPAAMCALRELPEWYSITDHTHQKVGIDHMLFLRVGNPFLIDLNFLE
jgi:hypothetical protein